jgi:NhaA family Na+:H+ antiporter
VSAPPVVPRSRFFLRFFETQAVGGIVLLGCAAVALVWANSPLAPAYHTLWATPFVVGPAGGPLALTLHQWINDGLMAVFFLLVGLEIKRELLAGELASPRQAALPIAAALGGMAAPALVYLAVAGPGNAAMGWAIPTATDIAFALGALALIAPYAPTGLKVFLAALAIVDDMGAVLVIALFYTDNIVWRAAGWAGSALVGLILLNWLGVRRLPPYLAIGGVLWFFLHESGVHATIAGVALAFAIPTRALINAAQFSAGARALLDEFDRTETGDLLVLTSKGQQDALQGLEAAAEAVNAPLLRLERALHGFTAFVVMPLFAISNAGVSLGGTRPDVGITLAVFLGLVAGKPLGIAAASFAVVRAGLAGLPAGVTWRMIIGCAWLGGIGFTMSLFIAGLAFGQTPSLDAAKTGILAGSLAAGVTGALVLRRAG